MREYNPREVLVPIEKRNVVGMPTFRTTDGEAYVRLADGSIRRATPKVNGKLARQMRRKMRGKVASHAG